MVHKWLCKWLCATLGFLYHYIFTSGKQIIHTQLTKQKKSNLLPIWGAVAAINLSVQNKLHLYEVLKSFCNWVSIFIVF